MTPKTKKKKKSHHEKQEETKKKKKSQHEKQEAKEREEAVRCLQHIERLELRQNSLKLRQLCTEFRLQCTEHANQNMDSDLIELQQQNNRLTRMLETSSTSKISSQYFNFHNVLTNLSRELVVWEE